jgi:protein TonB
MPHDLFGEVVVRSASRTALRRVLTICSVALHAFIISAVAIGQLFAVGPLPTPRRPLAFEEVQMVRLVDVELPVPPRRSIAPAADVSLNAAPTVVPEGIAAETGLENEKSGAERSEAFVGIERGIGSVDAIGTVERIAPLPPPPQPKPVRLHEGMQPPRKIVDAQPAYPEIAQRARVEGIVIIEAVIDTRGNIDSARVLRSLPLLDGAALDAVRQWKYTAALLNGVPVPVIVTVTVTFKLTR